MFSKGLGLLSIPETVFAKFNELLSKYYNCSQYMEESMIVTFMYENCIFGISYLDMSE